jgi:hypothetical protein
MGNDGLRIESVISLLGMTNTPLSNNWLTVGSNNFQCLSLTWLGGAFMSVVPDLF